MKRVFSLIIGFYLLINLSFGYVIENKENIRVVQGLEEGPVVYVPIDFNNFGTGRYYDYSILSDKNTVQKYVRSYEKGALTALQVCSNGGPNSGCDHVLEIPYDVLHVEFNKSEIIEITPPTCLTDGSMKIKCKNIVKRGGFLGIGAKEEECGEIADIILEKTDHNLKDDVCINCNEKHQKSNLLEQSDDNYHYYSCAFDGCEEVFKFEHDFLENTATRKWNCITCGKENTGHKAKDEWSFNANIHFKKCEVEGCTELFDEESHYGGTHSNEGECTRCKANYQNHNNIDTSSFTSDQKGHYYVCSVLGCNASIKEQHEKSTILEWNEDKHWYKCKNPDCDVRLEEESHEDGDNNDGICIVCKRKYTGELERLSIIGLKDNICILEEIGDNRILELEYLPTNLADTNFLWKSDDESIATVDQDGAVTAVSEGVTTVRVFWKEKEAFCSVFVSTPVFEIKVDKSELVEGEKTRIKVISDNMPDSIINEVSWEISDDNLAWVQDKFLYTGKGVAKSEGEEIIVWGVLPNGAIASTRVNIKHGKTSHDENGKCNICGNVIEKHTLSSGYEGYNSSKHWKICSNEKCEGRHFFEQAHTGQTNCSLCKWSEKGGSGGTPSGGTTPGGTTPGGTTPGGTTPGGTTSEEITPGGEPTNETIYNHNATHHWKVFKSNPNKMASSKVPHVFNNKICVCGMIEGSIEEECKKHIDTVYTKIEGTERHRVFCAKCGETVRDENCDGSPCSLCEAVVEPDTYLDIPIKVYYVEEDQQVEIKYTAICDNLDFKWTMSTIPNSSYNPNNSNSSKYKEFKLGETSNDGTIMFKHDMSKKCFIAELVPDDRVALSEEVEVTITLVDGGRTDSQKIKLIKNGPPRSACQVYFDNKYVPFDSGASTDTTLKLLIRTSYQDFDDKTVREVGESELPIYEIKGNSLKVKSKDTGILKITGQPQLSKVTDGSINGYIAEVPVTVVQNINNIGKTVQLEVDFTTVYEFNKHQAVEKERKYNAIITIVEKREDIPVTPPESNPFEEEVEEELPEEASSGSGVLAAAGVIGLLLVALIGSKMFGHR